VCFPVATTLPSLARVILHSIHASVLPTLTTSHSTRTVSSSAAGAQYAHDRSTLTPPRGVIVSSAAVVSTSTIVAIAPPCSVPKRFASSRVTVRSHENFPAPALAAFEHRRSGAASYVSALAASRRKRAAASLDAIANRVVTPTGTLFVPVGDALARARSPAAMRARRLATTTARAASSRAASSTAVERANRARGERRDGTRATRDDDDDDARATTTTTDATTRDAYVAALGDTVRKVKVLSLASLAATAVGCPTLVELSQPELALEAKAAVSATVIGFGGFTTALLQWFISPYVRSMRVDASKGTVTARKLRWNASEYETTFAASAMKESESSRPLVSWEADGKHYYVEMGMVPKYMYDELDLARFDDQAKAEAAAREMDDEE